MKVTVVKCPACGAKIDIKENSSRCICEFCGSIIISQSSASDKNVNDSLIVRAYLFLEDSRFDKADEYFERVLDINPHNSKAYIGKLLCQLRFSSIENLIDVKSFLTSYDYYNKAVRFANEEELQEYQRLNAAVLEKLNQEKLLKEQEMLYLQNDIYLKEKYLFDNKNYYFKCVAKKAIWKTLLIISICCVAFWTIGVIVAFPLIIIDIPFVVWMIFMIIKNNKIKSLTKKYNETKTNLQHVKTALNIKTYNYKQFIEKR